MKGFVSKIAVAETFARMVAFAINEPVNVDVDRRFCPTNGATPLIE